MESSSRVPSVVGSSDQQPKNNNKRYMKMKRIVITGILALILINVEAQTSKAQDVKSTNATKDDRWDLDRYIWSHTHYSNDMQSKPVLDFDAIDNWQGLVG